MRTLYGGRVHDRHVDIGTVVGDMDFLKFRQCYILCFVFLCIGGALQSWKQLDQSSNCRQDRTCVTARQLSK